MAESFVKLPLYSYSQWLEDYRERWRSIITLVDEIPFVDEQAINDMVSDKQYFFSNAMNFELVKWQSYGQNIVWYCTYTMSNVFFNWKFYFISSVFKICPLWITDSERQWILMVPEKCGIPMISGINFHFSLYHWLFSALNLCSLLLPCSQLISSNTTLLTIANAINFMSCFRSGILISLKSKRKRNWCEIKI